MAETPSAFFAAHPEAMQRTLDGIRREHGSLPRYLGRVGVDATVLATLADALTD